MPVQLIVNTEDPYVRPYGYDATARWVPRLWRRDIKAGHWSPMSHPQVLASAVHELVDYLDGKPPSRALLRAEVRRSRKCFGDMLVAVTGAGSGIGRATALAFAREGAEVVVSDIDETAAKDTAAQIAAQGGVAHPYSLDVADAEAVEAFAEQLCAEHGVPDIVVNNAGIGQAGRFLDTRPSSSTGCSTSISVAWSTGAARSPRGWSRAAPADTSSMSPRWPRGRPYSR
ncbi:short chain dehydrogenase family protein [Mycobacterium xenopi 3993]|nr:short chain dehydrogenase family protein [Mycobacterium xenopi 3993]